MGNVRKYGEQERNLDMMYLNIGRIKCAVYMLYVDVCIQSDEGKAFIYFKISIYVR